MEITIKSKQSTITKSIWLMHPIEARELIPIIQTIADHLIAPNAMDRITEMTAGNKQYLQNGDKVTVDLERRCILIDCEEPSH